jgi:hypothetical protein
VLLATRLDRMSRSVVDFAALMAAEQDERWQVVALDLGLDTSTTTGRMVAHILAAVAEAEREVIGQRTSAALVAKRGRGENVGRRTSLPPEVVARVVLAREQGKSYAAIAAELNAAAVPTGQGGGHWYPSTVRAVALSHQARSQAPPDSKPSARSRRTRAPTSRTHRCCLGEQPAGTPQTVQAVRPARVLPVAPEACGPRLGVPQLRLHDLRHTAATLWREDGFALDVISRCLGHASVAVTDGVYVHLRADDDYTAWREQFRATRTAERDGGRAARSTASAGRPARAGVRHPGRHPARRRPAADAPAAGTSLRRVGLFLDQAPSEQQRVHPATQVVGKRRSSSAGTCSAFHEAAATSKPSRMSSPAR